MKCKHCNGTGKIRGYFYEKTGVNKWEKVWGDSPCEECNETGEIEITNEEWFCQLPTEEKAKVLRRKTYGNDEENERIEQGWVNWLKAKHEDNPPDIPSVPSWDKWLEGERTKCTYCDGSGAECNLAGKFECPKTPKTEQEWLQTATTEQLAGFLSKVGELDEAPIPCGDLMECSKSCGLYSQCAGDDVMPTNEEIWVEWLKQPHTPIS